MTNPATIRTVNWPSSNENAPALIDDPAMIAILADAPLAWWTPQRNTMKGVVTSVAYQWGDLVGGVALTDAITGQNPISNSPSSGPQNLSMGYGGSLVQGGTQPIRANVHAGGSGWAVGDTATDAAGTVFTVTGVSTSEVISAIAVTTAATYSSYPKPPVAITAQSPSTGTGASVVLDFLAGNGSLMSPASTNILTPGATACTFISVFRCPLPGGAAGATPGGTLLCNAQEQSQGADVTANTHLTGLGVGYGQSGNVGKAVLRIRGDSLICYQSTAQDLRDGNWHVLIGGFTAGGTANLYLDGALISSLAVSAGVTTSTVAGGGVIRLGATGLPTEQPVFGFAGDLGDQLVYGIDLTLSANAAQRQRIGSFLLAKFGIGGTQA